MSGPLDPTQLHAAGSIVGATGLFVTDAGGRTNQHACGTLVRNGVGDYSLTLDRPIDTAEAVILLGYRDPVPALPVASSTRDKVDYPALVGAGANLIGQYAGGAVINDVIGPWTMPSPGRTVQIVLGVGGAPAVVYIVAGIGMNGIAALDVINAAGAGTYQGAVAFRRITGITSDIDPVGTTDLQVGNGFGVGGNVDAFIDLVVSGAIDAGAVMTAASGTVIPAAAQIPNGVRDFDVLFSRPEQQGTSPTLRLVHTTDAVKQILVGGPAGAGAADANIDFAIFRAAV